LGPSHAFAVISLVALAAAIASLNLSDLTLHARWIYVVRTVVALYLDSFVGPERARPTRTRARLRRGAVDPFCCC